MNIVGPIYTYKPLSLAELYQLRDRYSVYPSCQRDYVWKKSMKTKLIDSVLRGLPIPPITIVREDDGLLGSVYHIIDGQQRLRTILSYMDGEFPTAKTFPVELDIKPLEPGRKYGELSQAARSAFDGYPLTMCVVQNVNVAEIGLAYRRLQYQVKLTFAEKLYSYSSKGKEVAEAIDRHRFWAALYSGDKTRKQIYLAGTLIVLMETMGTFCNMTTPRLVDVARGTKDNDIWSEMPAVIEANLEYATRLYEGASLTGYNHVIPVYQSVMLLRDDGYNLDDAPNGVLAPWFMEVRREARDTQRGGFMDLFAVVTKVTKQREFWVKHYSTISGYLGQIPLDRRRAFSEIDKIDAWQRQGGKCAYCEKELRFQDGIAHHGKAHTVGGRTDNGNCMLVHRRCHTRAHADTAIQTALIP